MLYRLWTLNRAGTQFQASAKTFNTRQAGHQYARYHGLHERPEPDPALARPERTYLILPEITAG